MLAFAVVFLSGCDAGSAAVHVGDYSLMVPTGWEPRVEHHDDPDYTTVVLVPPGRTLLCRLEVLGAGPAGDSEVDGFLDTARQDFRGSQEQAVELHTRAGRLRGFAVRRAVEARGGKQTARGGSEIEVYAGLNGRDLLAAIAGGWSLDRRGRQLRRQCLEALASTRSTKGQAPGSGRP